MFKDLKKAFENMSGRATLRMNSPMNANDRSRSIAVPEELWDKFVQEYNLCFVEPEDDEDWQEYQNEGVSS